MLTDVEVVSEADVDTGDANATEVPHGLDALVDDLAGVGLEADGQLNGVSPVLGILASNALNGDVGTAAVDHLLQLRDNALAPAELGEVDSLDLGIALADEVQSPVLVDHDNALGSVHESKLSTHLANGSCAPDGNDVALVDAGVDDSVPAGADYVGEVQSLLIGNIVGQLEEVVVSVWHTSVLRLTASKATREVRVSKHARGPAAVHGVLDSVAVGALALRRQLLLAVEALAAGNLETGDDAVTLFQVLDAGSHLVYDTAELVAQDVALLELDDSAMVEVQVAAADGAASDLEDDIAVFENLGFRAVDWWKLWLALIKVTIPGCNCLHIPTSTLFFPIQASAFMVSFEFPHSSLLPGLVISWAVVALSPCPMACSTLNAACDIAMLKYNYTLFV